MKMGKTIMRVEYYLAFMAALVILESCKDNGDAVLPQTDLIINIQHSVGPDALAFDTLMYDNEAGERYSVSKLKYYISSLRLYKGSHVFLFDTVLYVDARKANQVKVHNVPAGSYDSIVCYIGVDATRNHHDSLAPTVENLAMQWPDGMGGGFHFLMLEGHWADGFDQPGYAVHLGTDPYLVTSTMRNIPLITEATETRLIMTMDINEWFKTPNVYSFSTDGVYTMGIPSLMKAIAENGSDVFSIKASD